MTIRYELNPPKVDKDGLLSKDELAKKLDKFKNRVAEISSSCDGIHITDSVLGTKRISPLTTAEIVRNNNSNLEVTVSLRVRDKKIEEVEKLVKDAIELGLEGILIIKGDPSTENPNNSGLIPSQVVKHLKDSGFAEKIDLYLSLPSKPNFAKIQKKIDAKPKGFITQVIASTDQVTNIVDALKAHSFKIIPIVLFPSQKNLKSAEFLKLDWSNYQDNVLDFIKNVHNITGDVLITSPNDFNGVLMTFRKLEI
ncbi:MAG: methylenetetrahydrofolate reductase [Nitrosopumilus sp.]